MKIKKVVYEIDLFFPERYISHPYWPEREEIINIQKVSGMNRVVSDDKRRRVLSEHLRRIGLTMEQYEEMEEKADRPWYRKGDYDTGEIFIPTHQMYGCLNAAAMQVGASLRPCNPENVRFAIDLTDLMTGKMHSDGVYARCVQRKSGVGKVLSNQRVYQRNPYIENFTATGRLSFLPDAVSHPEMLPDFLDFAGSHCGVGASRKMGCGRFEVARFDPVQK